MRGKTEESLRVSVLLLSCCVFSSSAKLHNLEEDGPKVQAVLRNLIPGDVVQFSPGTFTSVCNISIESPNVTISGAGMESTILKCSGEDTRVFNIRATRVSIRDLHMTGGLPQNGSGGCVSVQGTAASMENVMLSNCHAGAHGGGLFVSVDSELLLDSVEIAECDAETGGAIFVHEGAQVTVQGSSRFTSNTARLSGGAIECLLCASIVLTDEVVIQHNHADSDGGALHVSGGALAVHGAIKISNNSAFGHGGGIGALNASLTIAGQTTMSGNACSESGGAVAIMGSTLLLSDQVALLENVAEFEGGALSAANATVQIDGNVRLSRNGAWFGGAVSLAQTMFHVADNVSFVDNVADDSGGALFASESVVWCGSRVARGGDSGSEDLRQQDGSASFAVSFVANAAIEGAGGAFNCVKVQVVLRGAVEFALNAAVAYSGGAVWLSESALNASSGVNFWGNSGWHGGAIAGWDNSVITIGHGVQLVENHAHEGGGGALRLLQSAVSFDGAALVANNVAQGAGGAVWAKFSSVVQLRGRKVVFHNNSNLGTGGAINVEDRSEVHILDGAAVQNNGGNGMGFGGGVNASGQSKVWLDGAVIANNTAQYGAAVNVEQGSLLDCTRSLLAGNAAGVGGGGVRGGDGASVILRSGTRVAQNSAVDGGGGVLVAQDSRLVVIGGVVIEDNVVSGTQHACRFPPCGGGGIRVGDRASAELQAGVVVRHNLADVGGGLLLSEVSTAAVAGEVSHNQAADGAGIAVLNASTLHLSGGRCSYNSARLNGGCLFHAGQIVRVGGRTVMAANSASSGGAAFLYSGVELLSDEDCETTLSDNMAAGNGGAMQLVGSLALLQMSSSHSLVLTNNTAGVHGGALALSLGAALRVQEEVCHSGCPPSRRGDGICQPQCLSAACNWDEGDCDAVMRGSGADGQQACNRTSGPEQCSVFAQYAGCESACFRASCDWHRETCQTEKERMSQCPLYDAAVFRSVQATGLVYIKGGNSVGHGRCNSTCFAPDTEERNVTWTSGVVGRGALLLSLDTAWLSIREPSTLQRDFREVSIDAWVRVNADFEGRGYVASWERMGLFVAPFADQGFYFGVETGSRLSASGNWRRCVDGEERVITDMYGLVTDGDMHNYSAHLACSFILAPENPEGGCLPLELTITFHELTTEEDFDFLYLYDCSDRTCSSRSEVAGSPFNGHYEPFSLVSRTGIMQLAFASDYNINDLGFIATFEARSSQSADRMHNSTERFPGVFASGAWHHLSVAVGQDGSVKHFLNGSLVHTAYGGPMSENPLDGGFAIGQRFLGPENSVRGRFDGTIDELRVWATVRKQGTMWTDNLLVGCSELRGSVGLLLCFAFDEGRGQLAMDSVQGERASGIVGDKHMPWCIGMDDNGRRILDYNGVDLDLGLNWGFCSFDKPRLPGAAFDYRSAAMEAVAAMSMPEILRTYPRCGGHPLQFRGNKALAGSGGGLYQDSCDSASDSRGVCFFTGMTSVGGGMTLASFQNNFAAGAGGAAYVECSEVGSACEKLMGLPLAWPLSDDAPRKVLLHGNTAGTRVGPRSGALATSPRWMTWPTIESGHDFSPWHAPMQTQYVPGQDHLNLSVALLDDLGSLVVSTGGLPNEHLVAVLLCSMEGDCNGITALAPSVLHRFSVEPGDPLCRTIDAAQPVLCLDGETQVRVQLSVVAAPRIGTRTLLASCLPCPPGQSRRARITSDGQRRAWTCTRCDESQYVIDPNQGSSGCQPCPPGLVCYGDSQTQSKISGANWTVSGLIMKLHSCPEGYQILPGAGEPFDPVLQQCISCGTGEECVRPPCVSCRKCQPGQYKDSSEPVPCKQCPENRFLGEAGAQTLSSCTPCPARSSTRGRTGQTSVEACVCDADRYLAVHSSTGERSCEICPRGAVCDGSDWIRTVGDLDDTGEVRWERSQDGVYHLKHCPRGYRMYSTALTLQECQKCGFDEYILASNDTEMRCLRCPEGLWCIDSGPPSRHPPVSGQLSVSSLEMDQFTSFVALQTFLKNLIANAAGGASTTRVGVTLPCTSLESCTAGRRAGIGALQVAFQAVSDSDNSVALKDRIESGPFAAAIAEALHTGYNASILIGPLVLAEAATAAGEFEIRDGALILTSCPEGHLKINSTVYAQRCHRCEALRYSLNYLDGCGYNDEGMVCADRRCQSCPAGATCNGGSNFEPLVKGSVWELEQGAEVLTYRVASCPPGFVLRRHQSKPVQDGCEVCPAGSYALVPSVFSRSGIDGSSSLQQHCLPCPANARCLEGDLVDAVEGYWRGADMLCRFDQETGQASGCQAIGNVAHGAGRRQVARIYRCKPGVCRGGSNASREPKCRVGHHGVGCGLCDAGFGLKGRTCEPCEGDFGVGQSLVYYAVLPLLGVVFLVLWYWFALRPLVAEGGGWEGRVLGWCLSCCSLPIFDTLKEFFQNLRDTSDIAAGAKILVGFAQVFGSMLDNLAVSWPSNIIAMMEWVTVLQLQFVSMPGTGCLLREVSYFDRLKAQTLFPVFVIAVLALPTFYANLAGMAFYGGMKRHPKYEAVFNRFIQSFFIVTFIIYPSVSSMTLRAFRCTDYGADGLLLDVDHRIDCRGSEYRNIRIWSWVCVFLYPFGIPAFMLAMLLREGVRSKAQEKAAEARFQAMLVLWKRQSSSRLKAALAIAFGSRDDHEFAQRVDDMFVAGMESRVGSRHQDGLCPRKLRRAISYMTQIPEAQLPPEQVEALFERHREEGAGLRRSGLHRMMRDVVTEQSMFTGQEREREVSMEQLRFLYQHDWALPIPRSLAESEQELEYNFQWYQTESQHGLRHSRGSEATDATGDSTTTTIPPTPLANTEAQEEAQEARNVDRIGAAQGRRRRSSVEMLAGVQGVVMTEKQLREWLHSTATELNKKHRIAVHGTVWNDDGDVVEQRAIARLGFLFLSYRTECWWFEIVMVLYKLCMSSFVIFFFPGTPSQVAAAFLITFAVLILNLVKRAFVSEDLFRMQVYSLVTQTLNLFLGILIISGAFEESIGSDTDDQYLSGFMVTLNLMVFMLPFLQLVFDARGMYLRYLSTMTKVNRMLATSKLDRTVTEEAAQQATSSRAPSTAAAKPPTPSATESIRSDRATIGFVRAAGSKLPQSSEQGPSWLPAACSHAQDEVEVDGTAVGTAAPIHHPAFTSSTPDRPPSLIEMACVDNGEQAVATNGTAERRQLAHPPVLEAVLDGRMRASTRFHGAQGSESVYVCNEHVMRNA